MVGLIQKLLFDMIESSAGADAAREVVRWLEVRDPSVKTASVASLDRARRWK